MVKLLGGGYLVYIAVKHLFFESKEHTHEKMAIGPDGQPILVDEKGEPVEGEPGEPEIRSRTPGPVPKIAGEPVDSTGTSGTKFWSTVGVIELTDIAFAVDSILAAIALVGPAPEGMTHPKLWVVITGGMLGVILMRFAAVVFIKLLEKFPRFETAAYLLVAVIGGKLLVDWYFNVPGEEHPRVDFHSPGSMAFWVFWLLMVACFLVGFIPQKKTPYTNDARSTLIGNTSRDFRRAPPGGPPAAQGLAPARDIPFPSLPKPRAFCIRLCIEGYQACSPYLCVRSESAQRLETRAPVRERRHDSDRETTYDRSTAVS